MLDREVYYVSRPWIYRIKICFRHDTPFNSPLWTMNFIHMYTYVCVFIHVPSTVFKFSMCISISMSLFVSIICVYMYKYKYSPACLVRIGSIKAVSISPIDLNRHVKLITTVRASERSVSYIFQNLRLDIPFEDITIYRVNITNIMLITLRHVGSDI